jgi:hypothetical protein
MAELSVLLFVLLFVLFTALQGAVVFETARRSLRLVRVSHWLGKIVAMFLSYLGWISLTIAGYTLTVGDASLFPTRPLGAVLVLCFTAMVSSSVYLIIWLRRPSEEPKEELRIEPFV